MKKVVTIIGIIVCVIVTIGVAVFVLVYTGVLSKNDISLSSVSTYTTEDGLTYTEKKWDWSPKESKQIISYVDTSAVSKRVVTLSLDSGLYYDVKIPDVPYIYDFGKTVWAEDGSFMIRVIGNADMSTLSAMAGIDNGENINQFTIKSPDGKKGARVVATLIGNTAIIANVYYGNDAYSIIRDSIADNRDSYEIGEVPFAKGCTYLKEVSYTGTFAPSISYSEVSMSSDKHLFENGALWVQSIVQPFDQASKLYLEKLVTASASGKVEQYYTSDKLMFAKSGTYYCAVIYHNTNTSIAMVGEGEEALCNIVSIINSNL